ncbi:hypothetical protein IG631_24064 [Alternaria alternata]|nr:hypothetical protein IG631_24064 [Alternaria alternata]
MVLAPNEHGCDARLVDILEDATIGCIESLYGSATLSSGVPVLFPGTQRPSCCRRPMPAAVARAIPIPETTAGSTLPPRCVVSSQSLTWLLQHAVWDLCSAKRQAANLWAR